MTGAQLTLFAKARWLVAALTGAAGIGFVLMGAAGSLEAKQAFNLPLPDSVQLLEIKPMVPSETINECGGAHRQAWF